MSVFTINTMNLWISRARRNEMKENKTKGKFVEEYVVLLASTQERVSARVIYWLLIPLVPWLFIRVYIKSTERRSDVVSRSRSIAFDRRQQTMSR